MTDHLLRKGRGWRRTAHVACALVSIAGAGAVGGCLNRPLEPNEPRRTSTIVEPFTQSAVDKIDLVLMIDNSRSMADKQLILAAAVPDLVGALVNPKCVDPKGTPMTTQPADVKEACPVGLVRDFKPITNIHIGIITSSLGGHGSDSCSVTNDVQSCPGGPNPSNNDAGHLISRQDACGGAAVPTYGNRGFLAWDPDGKLTPPGEKVIGSIIIDAKGNVTDGTPGIVPSLRDLVIGVGQVGCGYEAQLESWYRFLIDPEPYKDITLQGGKATPSGTDMVLLQQRADFLRPSSLLAIIMLTDENDCSVRESQQYYYAVQQQNPQDNKKKFHLPRARKECAINPNDPCCKSCGQAPGSCPVDDLCTTSPTLSDSEDDINLRCFDQKRRFGIDFLYGIDRYRDALSSKVIPNREGMMVANPIFTDLNPNDEDSQVRDKGLVFIAGIIGVPWQDIARDSKDLTKGFKNSEELAKPDETTKLTTWDNILGDPANYVPPKDPHMIESIQPRAGLPGPTSPVGADPINGHEYTIKNNDLQYACIFALPAPRDCAVMGVNGCDCNAGSDNPLCDPTATTLQVRAKGYPGLRELAVLKAVDKQGIVASICPKWLDDKTKPDYGYRPAIGSIIDRLKTALGGQCLPRQLAPDANGQVPCLIIEASTVPGSTACDTKLSRREVADKNKSAIKVAKADVTADPKWNKFCEIIQTGDETGGSNQAQLDACQANSSAAPIDSKGNGVNGWCYVDPTQKPSMGSEEIVKACPATEKRLIRFVGNGNPSAGGKLFITCTGE